MVLMKPTSIAYSGTSATLGANGQVTFSAVTSLSLNGCFTADFDNYVVSFRAASTADTALLCRLRASGSDTSTSTYTYQYLAASSTTVSAERFTSQTNTRFTGLGSTMRTGDSFHFYGPYLAQPTAMRNVSGSSQSSAYIFDAASTQSGSVSFDGFTVYLGSGNFTGALQVYGVRS
jgi:phosphate-selective porin